MVSEVMNMLGLGGFEPIAAVVFLAAWSLVLLLVGVWSERAGVVAVLSGVGFAVAAWLLSVGGVGLVANVLRVDDLSVVAGGILLGLAVLLLPLLWRGMGGKLRQPELYVLLTLCVAGMLGLMVADNLLALYVMLELMSFPLYIMAAYARDDARSSEAGLKYFVLGSMASGVLLFGASVLYVVGGTLDFGQLAAVVAQGQPLALVGMALVVAGVLFKLSVVPFHMWTPDVYEGAPTPVTAVMAALPKVAALVLLVRLVAEPFAAGQALWQPALVVLAGVSMLVGATLAVVQRHLKRLLAYSTIANVGFVVAGVAAASGAGFGSAVVYVAIYGLATVGIFAAILLAGAERVDDLRGLAGREPVVAVLLLVLLFSLAGVPPLAGFMAKFGVLAAVVGAGYPALALVGVVASVIALFYCLWLVKVMFFELPEAGAKPVVEDFGLLLVLGFAVAGVVVLGIWPWILTGMVY